jgi:DNA-3-methyladenine glycosylase II
VPAFEWRTRIGGFEGLFRMIVEQQGSLASAAAIWKRTVDGLGGVVRPEAVLARDIETLRSFGLSGQKARYAHEIARAQTEGRIDFDHLGAAVGRRGDARPWWRSRASDEWTAETFLMFCEGRHGRLSGRRYRPAGGDALGRRGLSFGRNEKQAYVRAERWAAAPQCCGPSALGLVWRR